MKSASIKTDVAEEAEEEEAEAEAEEEGKSDCETVNSIDGALSWQRSIHPPIHEYVSWFQSSTFFRMDCSASDGVKWRPLLPSIHPSIYPSIHPSIQVKQELTNQLALIH